MPEPAVGEEGAQRRQEQAELPVPPPGKRPAGTGTASPGSLSRGLAAYHPSGEDAESGRTRPRRNRPRGGQEPQGRRPQTPRVLSPRARARALGSSGVGHTGRARSPEPGSARGTGAGSSEWSFSSARAARRGGANARQELQQVRFLSLPCPAQEPR